MQVCSGLKWRAYDDGVVVYVPTTCETHLLAPELASILRSGIPGSSESQGSAGRDTATFNAAFSSKVADQVIHDLIALKILDAGT